MRVTEYLAARGLSLFALCRAVGLSYTTLHPHVKHGKPVSLRTAQKLEEWSKREPCAETIGAMNASEILGLAPPAPPPTTMPRKRSPKKTTPSRRARTARSKAA